MGKESVRFEGHWLSAWQVRGWKVQSAVLHGDGNLGQDSGHPDNGSTDFVNEVDGDSMISLV